MQSINLVDAEIYGDIVQHTFNDIQITFFFFFKHIYNEIQFVVLSQTLKCKFLDIRADGYHS